MDPSQIAPAVFIKKCLELAETVFEKEQRVRIFIFGSRAFGGAVPQADIDLGINIGHPISPWVMGRIREEFEHLPIFQKVDVRWMLLIFLRSTKILRKSPWNRVFWCMTDKLHNLLKTLEGAISRFEDALNQAPNEYIGEDVEKSRQR